METVEERLRALLLQGLDADAAAYQRFLKELSAHLRAFLRRRLAQRPDEVEDLVRIGRDAERLALARALRLVLRRQVLSMPTNPPSCMPLI